MKYSLTNKITGDRQRYFDSVTELEQLINTFLAFNTKKKFKSLDDKIKYYNKASFYDVKEV